MIKLSIKGDLAGMAD